MTLNSPRGGEADELPSEKQKSGCVRLRLMCEACGHTWSPRNTAGASRHCSKCDSKKIVEVSGDNAVLSPETASQKAEVVVEKTSVPPTLKDDPDIRQKMKELELARLDKQIREAKEGLTSDTLVERLVINHIMALDELLNSRAIDLRTHRRLTSSCPWCGATGDKGMTYEEGFDDHPEQNGYRCASCGHWVPYW